MTEYININKNSIHIHNYTNVFIVICICLLSNISTATADTVYSSEITRNNLQQEDSLIVELEKRLTIAIDQNDTLKHIRTLGKISDIKFMTMRNQEALNNMSNALLLAEEANLIEEQIKNHIRLSRFYNKHYKYDIALNHLFKARSIINLSSNKQQLTNYYIYSIYSGIIESKKKQEYFEIALQYIDSSYAVLEETNAPRLRYNNLIRTHASVYITMDSTQKALDLLVPLIEFNKRKSKNGKVNLSDNILIYSNIGRAYFDIGEHDLALDNYLKSLNLIYKTNNKVDHQVQVMSYLATIYKAKGEFKLAYSYLRRAHDYSNKNLRTSSDRSRGIYTVQNSYLETIEEQEKEILAKELEIAKRDEEILHFRIFILILSIFIVIAAGLTFGIIRNRSLKREQKLIQEEADVAKQELEHKSRELTSYTLQMLEREDLLNKYNNYICADKSKEAKSLQISHQHISRNTWDEFEKRFVDVNRDFYNTLKSRYPNLTQSDLKYCALIKLGLSGKEIAKLIGVSDKSVHMASYRLRKKISIETNENLAEFLNLI